MQYKDKAPFLAFLICMLLSGCHFTHGPVVYNSSNYPIYIEIKLSGRGSYLSLIAPNSALWQGTPNQRLEYLSVNGNGKKMILTAKDIDRMQKERNVKEEVWVVRQSTIELDDLARLWKLRQMKDRF